MDYLQALLALTGVYTLSVISPGPNFAIVTSTTLGVSRRAGVMTGLGLALASFTWSLLSVLGIGLIIAHAGWLYDAIRLAGGAYLIWLGFKMVRGARQPQQLVSVAPTVSASRSILKGYLVSMTSPKAIAFYGSIFATFVPQHAPLWVFASIVAIATVVSGLWYCGVALLLSNGPMQAMFARAKTVLDLTIGACLMGFGARLLLSR